MLFQGSNSQLGETVPPNKGHLVITTWGVGWTKGCHWHYMEKRPGMLPNSTGQPFMTEMYLAQRFTALSLETLLLVLIL